jgi:ribosomal protein L3 glutamine methyltransferase
LIRSTVGRFETAELHYGHGTDNVEDEALFLILHALGWPYEVDDIELERALGVDELGAIEAIVSERIESRRPAAYLTGRMWFAELEYYVDERVLVPRSPLAELIRDEFQPWRGSRQFLHILDIGTGSGCIAIAAAVAFPNAHIDATDVSPGALEVAAINRRRHRLEGRVELIETDLFPPEPRHYDLIVSNPPYVPSARMATLPQEYQAEPKSGLAAGPDGFDCVERILKRAPDYLAADGLLVVEVGEIWPALERHYPQLEFTWVALRHGGEGVFVLTRAALAGLV